jgi:hypothetical protein
MIVELMILGYDAVMGDIMFFVAEFFTRARKFQL